MYYSDKTLIERLKDSPQPLKNAVANLNVADIISEIGTEQDLLIREIGEIYDKTADVIAGALRPEDFVVSIRTVLDDDNKSKTENVAKAINERILLPIRESFKKATMGNLSPETNKPAIPNIALPPQDIKPLTFSPAAPKIEPEPVKPLPQIPQGPMPDVKIEDRETEPELENISLESSVPVNLPVDLETQKGVAEFSTEPKEVPVWRTMQTDAASTGNSGTALPNRGKFGAGNAPLSARKLYPRTETPSESQAKESVPAKKPDDVLKQIRVNSIPAERRATPATPPPPPPTPLTPPPTPPPPSKPMHTEGAPDWLNSPAKDVVSQDSKSSVQPVQSNPSQPGIAKTTIQTTAGENGQVNHNGEDIIGDKLTKIVRIPSERKQYVVDPYREPLE